MTRFSPSRPSPVLSVLLLFTLLSGFFAIPVYGKSSTANSSSSSKSQPTQTPSWLLSLLRDHQDGASGGMPGKTRGAIPMDIRINESINIRGQTIGNLLYYSPSEIREAYNSTTLLKDGYTGAGETISIVDAYGDPYIQGELNNFSEALGIPLTNVHVACVDGPCNFTKGITTGWNGEIALDVEWAHAMAPGATINLYIGSNDGQPLYDAVAAAVAGTNGNGTYLSPSSIVSMSWGSPENDIGESGAVAPVFGENYPWLNKVFQLGVAEGITFFASTGDWGAYDQTMEQDSPYGGAIYPSTDPFVTGVGGTSLYLSTNAGLLEFPAANATGGYGYETAWSWNNYCSATECMDWGTGGGFSTMFGQPSWQSGPGMPSGETRGAPDVSWDADPMTGVLVYVSGGFYAFGGTSLGSPSWAGAMALIDQYAGRNLGLINPSIYSILNDPTEYAKAFHDVTVGDNDPNQAGKGWDPLTGVGTPNIGELAYYLAQPSQPLAVNAFSSVAQRASASYTSVQIYATVTSGGVPVTSGVASAELTSSNGTTLGSVTMTYNGTLWTGTYTIKPTDPPGMWTATVSVTSGSQSGTGTTTFSVGDGVTIFASWGYFEVWDTIPIAAVVTSPDGSVVTSGTFSATFYLGTPAGAPQGSVSLTYNGSMWVGSFSVKTTVHQGEWVLSINGTDSEGNRAAIAYSWVYVGLFALVLTDSPTYVLGGAIDISAYVCAVVSGVCIPSTSEAYEATVSSNGATVGTVSLSFTPTGAWVGTLKIAKSDALGFYNIVVTGHDKQDDAAYGETLVRVAPMSLDVTAAVSKATAFSNETEAVSASVTYPNATVMTVGSVEAITSYGFVAPMTYNSVSEEFYGLLPLNGLGGNYNVTVSAFDPFGNYQQEVVAFHVFSVTSTSIGCSSPDIPLLTASSLSVKCTAVVTGASPTGDVSWSSSVQGSVSFNSTSCELSSTDRCSIIVVGNTLGPVAIDATYSGDSNNLPSKGSLAVTVSPVEVRCKPSPIVVGASTKCTATVVSIPKPTGTISWSSDSYGVFSVKSFTLKKGSCSVTYTSASAGTANITASYSGHYSGTFTLTVNPKASKIAVSCVPKSLMVGSPTTTTCTAVLKGYFPTGEVTWSMWSAIGGAVTLSPSLCSLTPSSSCVAGTGTDKETVTATGTATAPGTVTITAIYSGDSNNTSSSGAAKITISRARPTLSVSCQPSSISVESSTTCSATLSGFYGKVSGETITWSKTSGSGKVFFEAPACSLSAGASGLTCYVTVEGTSHGSAVVKATYSGDFFNVGSKATTTITITST